VVCGGKPAITKTGDAAQARLRAPASHPQDCHVDLTMVAGQIHHQLW
jgi:hypothetical protein